MRMLKLAPNGLAPFSAPPGLKRNPQAITRPQPLQFSKRNAPCVLYHLTSAVNYQKIQEAAQILPRREKCLGNCAPITGIFAFDKDTFKGGWGRATPLGSPFQSILMNLQFANAKLAHAQDPKAELVLLKIEVDPYQDALMVRDLTRFYDHGDITCWYKPQPIHAHLSQTPATQGIVEYIFQKPIPAHRVTVVGRVASRDMPTWEELQQYHYDSGRLLQAFLQPERLDRDAHCKGPKLPRKRFMMKIFWRHPLEVLRSVFQENVLHREEARKAAVERQERATKSLRAQ